MTDLSLNAVLVAARMRKAAETIAYGVRDAGQDRSVAHDALVAAAQVLYPEVHAQHDVADDVEAGCEAALAEWWPADEEVDHLTDDTQRAVADLVRAIQSEAGLISGHAETLKGARTDPRNLSPVERGIRLAESSWRIRDLSRKLARTVGVEY